MKHLHILSIIAVCSTMLPVTSAKAEEKMTREPLPGEKLEKTDLSDNEIIELLTGEWMYEEEIGVLYTIKFNYRFDTDGSYTAHVNVSINGTQKLHTLKGDWEVKDAIITASNIRREGVETSGNDDRYAYKILAIDKIKMKWQADPAHSESSTGAGTSETIITFERVK